MKHYFKNLVTALCGSNPYQLELDDVREKYEKTAERVEQLEGLYNKALERWDEASKQLSSYQTLVENLRERVAEKDALVDRLKEESAVRAEGYRRRIEDYSAQVARLQGELAKARKRGMKPKTVKKKNQKEPDVKQEPQG